jgi:hypothetical protein
MPHCRLTVIGTEELPSHWTSSHGLPGRQFATSSSCWSGVSLEQVLGMKAKLGYQNTDGEYTNMVQRRN